MFETLFLMIASLIAMSYIVMAIITLILVLVIIVPLLLLWYASSRYDKYAAKYAAKK
jgi:hypothetical protein